jgi:sec-independent protein translocase protein TatC
VDDTAQPLTEHLSELRTRLIRLLLAWVVAAVVCWNWAESVFRFLLAPAVAALGPEHKLQAIAPTEIFFTYLKCALLGGFFLAFPAILWQVWAFIAPGLYSNEKRVVVPFVAASTLLFAGGAVFGYELVFPVIFHFFTTFDSDFVQSAWTMREVFGLTSRLFLAFGIAFELPIFVFFLSAAGVVDARQLLKSTPYAVLAVFVAAAVITPPDVVSQVFLAVPMIALYLVGVAVAWVFGGRRRRAAPQDSAVVER